MAFENRVRLHEREHGAAFAADGRLILEKVGEPDSIEYDDGELERMHGLVFTHNHPSGASFSVADVKLAARIGLSELRAVGPQFRYILTPGPDGWVPSSAVDGAYPGALEQARRIGDDLVLRQGLRLASASSELMHRGWVEFARKAKIAYTRQNS